MIDLSHLNGFVRLTLFKMETVASMLLSVREVGFPSFHRFEGRVFPDTRSSVIEEAIEVPVGGDSLPVQSPVFQTVDCPTGLYLGVRRCVCVGPLPRDSSAAVPGRLAGPCLFGGGGQTPRPGPSLALSLPRDSDKRGQVRLRSLADSELPWYDHRYRGRQDLSVSCASREISVGGGDVLCFDRSPSSALAGALGSPGFAGEAGPARSPSNALPAVAFEDALVPRVRFSFPSGAPVPGGAGGPVLVDGAGPSSHGGSVRDTCSRSTPVLGRLSIRVGRTPPRSGGIRSVVEPGEIAAHNLLKMKALFLALQSFQELVTGHHVTAMCDNLTVVAYVSRQGGTISRSLCLLASQLLRWAESLDVHLDARYLPGQSNVLADLLSRRDQVIGTEWFLHPRVARDLLRRWGSPSIDLFAMSFNTKLPLYCSLIPDPQTVFEDAFRHPWDNLDLYAFPPFPLVGRVVARVRETPNLSMTLAGEGVVRVPSPSADPTTSGASVVGPVVAAALLQQVPQRRTRAELHSWRLSSVSSESRAFCEVLLSRCPAASAPPLPGCTR